MTTWREWHDRFKWHRRTLQDKWEAWPTSRRTMLGVALLAVAIAVPIFTASVVFRRHGQASREGRFVVLYTSIDEPIHRPIIDEFTRQTDIQVRIVSDTEATKTTGLVKRLIDEKDAPRADVWWSGEPLSTMILSKNGVLAKYASTGVTDMPQGWPSAYRPKDGTWYGLALRSRVIAFNTNRVKKEDAPTTLRALAEPKWRGKVGMARPQFGSTRMMLAALVASSGGESVREWLGAMVSNGVRLYDGNSAVVRALSVGEIEVGLTDTDDVYAARRNAWPVDMAFVRADPPRTNVSGMRSIGPVHLPCTVALVRGGPNFAEARRLADYLIGAEAERRMAQSEAGHWPIRPGLQREFPALELPKGAEIDLDALPGASEEAGKIIAEVFGS